MEITYVSDSSSIVYKPVEYGKGKFDYCRIHSSGVRQAALAVC